MRFDILSKFIINIVLALKVLNSHDTDNFTCEYLTILLAKGDCVIIFNIAKH